MSDRLTSLLLSQAKHNDKIVVQAEKMLADLYQIAYNNIVTELAALYVKIGKPPSLIESRKYNRLKVLQLSIAEQFRAMTRTAIDTTLDTSTKGFVNGFYGTAFSYINSLGADLSFALLSADAIRASVWSSATGADFEERFKNWAQKDYIAMNQAITRGLATGKSYKEVALDISNQLGKTYNEAVRIVRTENTRNYTLGHLSIYDQASEMGVNMQKQWIATLDVRTRHSHAGLDKSFADSKGLFYAGGGSAEGPGLFNIPSEDINCRCRVVEIVEGLEPEFRRIRGEGIVKDVSFENWAKPKGWDPEKGWPIEAKTRISNEQKRVY